MLDPTDDTVSAGTISLLSALVMKPVLSGLAEAFTRETGQVVAITYDSAGAIVDRLRKGEVVDAAIVQRRVLEALAQEGRVALGSTVTLARSGIAVAVRKGAPKPAIEPIDALKRSLLAAKSIAYPDPAIGHASGLQFQRVIERLEIARQVNSKTKFMEGALASFALRDEAEIAITQPMEILAAPAYTLVGWLPQELQDDENFTWAVGVTTNAREPDAARALVRFLCSPAAAAAIEARGMVPERQQGSS